MSLDIRYSDSLKEGEGHYHDFRYTSERELTKDSETTFTIENECGNEIVVEFKYEDQSYQLTTNQVKITMRGGVENRDFLRALQTILEAEKISELLGG
jgi:hypothetical protein